MFECHDPLTSEEKLDIIACLDDLCDMCITQETCCGCAVTEIRNIVDECEVSDDGR